MTAACVARPDWRALIRLGRGEYRWLLAGVIATVLRSILLLAATLAIGRLVTADAAQMRWYLAAAAVACTTTAGCLSYGARILTMRAVKRIVGALRRELVARTLALPSRRVGAWGADALRHILAQDSERLDHMCSALLGVVLPATILAAAATVALLTMAPMIGIVAAAMCGLLLLFRRSGRRLRAHADDAQGAIEQLDAGMALLLRRHELAKSAGAEPFEQAERSTQIGWTAERTAGIAQAMARLSEVESMQASLLVLLLIGGTILLPAKLLSMTALAPLLFLLVVLRGNIQSALTAMRDMAGGVPAVVRLQSLLAMDIVPAIPDGIMPQHQRIEARRVRFSHGAGPLLTGVDLTLERGDVVAIGGPNGCGKTTLINIILGLVDPQSGAILVDGIDLCRCDRQAYRHAIGHVPQSPVLFRGTIAENIAYALRDASPATIRDAADRAGVTAFCQDWPEGLERQLGDEGAPLSGGQRQRIAFARALARRPRLLILDEPTNHLDMSGVEALIVTLRNLPERPAVLIISHDPIILDAADRRYTLGGGLLQAANPHDRSALSAA